MAELHAIATEIKLDIRVYCFVYLYLEPVGPIIAEMVSVSIGFSHLYL